jgi:integrase
VPIPAALRDHLLEQRMATDGGYLFGGATAARQSMERGSRAIAEVGLGKLTIHDCRHSYASLMIAAGVNAKALSTFMGHATTAITLEIYGHLMPGAEDEAAELLDAYLARAVGGTDPGPTAAQTAAHPAV